MVTRSIAVLLIFCSFSLHLSGWITNAGFELNRKYIATQLCVNKAKPELNCNGRCYLVKKLKQAEEKEQREERQSQKLNLQSPESILRVLCKQYLLPNEIKYVPLTTGTPFGKTQFVFHPPQLTQPSFA